MLFYIYDYTQYAGELRGLYLGLSELPGPVIQEQDELVSAIKAAASPNYAWRPALEKFAQRFAGLDDGNATKRVLARIFDASGQKEGSQAT